MKKNRNSVANIAFIKENRLRLITRKQTYIPVVSKHDLTGKVSPQEISSFEAQLERSYCEGFFGQTAYFYHWQELFRMSWEYFLNQS